MLETVRAHQMGFVGSQQGRARSPDAADAAVRVENGGEVPGGGEQDFRVLRRQRLAVVRAGRGRHGVPGVVDTRLDSVAV